MATAIATAIRSPGRSKGPLAVGAADTTTTRRNRSGSSLGAAAQSQPSVARRRGRRIGATAMSVHHTKKRPPTGMAVHIVPILPTPPAGSDPGSALRAGAAGGRAS